MSLAVKSSSRVGLRQSVSRSRALVALPLRSRRALEAKALLGPDGKPGGAPAKKKFISREEEPEQYWTSKGEADGTNPMKDPLAIIGVLAIFFPFIFLAVAVGAGLIDLSVYR